MVPPLKYNVKNRRNLFKKVLKGVRGRLIHSVSLDKPLWIENDARRNEKFKAILNSGDHVIIIQRQSFQLR